MQLTSRECGATTLVMPTKPDSVSLFIIIISLIVQGTGYVQDESTGKLENYTMTNFFIDPDYACSVFQSCRKVSFISQASLTSSIAFLDFLGTNGKVQGKSVITFEFESNPKKSLSEFAASCGTPVYANETFHDYNITRNCTCAFCDEACTPTSISNVVNFFDGFNGSLVGVVYLVLIGFSVIF